MAFVGLTKIYVAKLVTEATKTYSDGFKCGKAMNINITPNYNEAKLYGDNQLAENVKEFKDGNMTLGTTTLPSKAAEVMFGHAVTEENTEITYSADDTGNYVGVGFVVDQMIDGVKTYVATIVYKVKFSEGADDYATKGDNIEFKSPSLDGTISALETGEWKTTKQFKTLDEADTYLKTTLKILQEAA